MDYTISRSEKKRRAKSVEQLAGELARLSDAEIDKLPCDDALREDIRAARTMQAGSWKRQLKYIAKSLRQGDPDPMYRFLAEQKGSKIEQEREFHELERLRDDIISDAMAGWNEACANNDQLYPENLESNAVAAALNMYPGLDENNIKTLAIRFAVTRKTVHKKGLFRALKAAKDRLQYVKKIDSSDESG